MPSIVPRMPSGSTELRCCRCTLRITESAPLASGASSLPQYGHATCSMPPKPRSVIGPPHAGHCTALVAAGSRKTLVGA
jgi:hypothetical protein